MGYNCIVSELIYNLQTLNDASPVVTTCTTDFIQPDTFCFAYSVFVSFDSCN